MHKPRSLAITGPTASGKSDAAFELALLIRKKLNKETEIISADSRQIYKHIPIVTSHPPKEYLKKIRHYFVDCFELDKEFNAGEFGKAGREILNKLLKQNKFPIVAGGSGLYLKSLLYGLFEFEEDNLLEDKRKKIRLKLSNRMETEGPEKLLNELKQIDPESASGMTLSNKRRIIRALEIYYLTGNPISSLHKQKLDIGFEPVIYGLNWQREILYDRINKRADFMITSGLVEEIQKLRDKGYNYENYNSLNTVGVKEVFDYLDGKINYERMTELIKQNTRRFAKRQMTWFRKDKNIKWIDVKEPFDAGEIALKIFEDFMR